MILFGEIEQIKCFPSKHYSIVEFRSIDEARRAKEGLQGRLFNDPRIQILFSTSELMSSKDNLLFIPGPRAPRPDMFFGERPFGHMEQFGHGRPMGPGGFPRALLHGGMLGRSFPQQGLELPPFGSPEFFNDHGGPPLHGFPEGGNGGNPMGPGFRRLSPSGILSAAPGMRPPGRPLPGMWEALDARDAKRLRIEGSVDEASLHASRMGGGAAAEGVRDHHQAYGGPGRRSSPVPGRRPAAAASLPAHSPAGREHIWRGVIAKGGTPVCCARCVPLGKGIESPL